MPTEEELVGAFSRLAQVWDIRRRGIIISFTGDRVATWNWNKNRMSISPEDREFRKVLRNLNKDGIFKRVPAKKLPGNEDVVNTSALVSVPLSQTSPGELDHALKLEGYFLVDMELPLVTT